MLHDRKRLLYYSRPRARVTLTFSLSLSIHDQRGDHDGRFVRLDCLTIKPTRPWGIDVNIDCFIMLQSV